MYTVIMGSYMEQLESNSTADLNIALGFIVGFFCIAMMSLLFSIIKEYQEHIDKTQPKRALKKAAQRMVRDDVASDYQNERSIQSYLSSDFNYRDLTDNESVYLEKMYRKYLKKTQQEFMKHKKAKDLCERLEERRTEYHAMLDEVHPRAALSRKEHDLQALHQRLYQS